ncbi:MAG: hypothetical protein D4R97_06885, partial [Bacteroidetes bacterium]
MKKIKSIIRNVALVIFLMFLMGRVEAQGSKGVDCSNVKWTITKDPGYPCRFNITLKYSVTGLSNASPFDLPHGIFCEVSGGTISTVGAKTETPVTFHWFAGCKQVLAANQQNIFWIKQVHCGTTYLDFQKNMIPSGDLLTIPIDISPNPTNNGVINFHLWIITGDAWHYYDNSPPDFHVDCNTASNITTPPSVITENTYTDCDTIITEKEANPNYKIYCDAASNNDRCSLCPPTTAADAVLSISPTPPAGSKIEWFKYTDPVTCPSSPSGTSFSITNNSSANGVTCPTGGPLNTTTCWMARITTGCYSWITINNAIIEVCKSGGCPITADSIAPDRALQFIDNGWHACSHWSGILKISPFTCTTTIKWYKKNLLGVWVLLATYNYTPLNPVGLQWPTGVLNGFPGPCYVPHYYKVKYSNSCGPDSCTFTINIDNPTQKGIIKADPSNQIFVGFGNVNGPVLCAPGYTNLKYYQATGHCEKVIKWQISVNTDPCGNGTNWTAWQDIQGSSNGPSPTWATNLL